MPLRQLIPHVALFALGLGCPGQIDPRAPGNASASDAGPVPDDSAQPEDHDNTFTCGAQCAAYVADRILLPGSEVQAEAFGVDVAGQRMNALGSILATVAQLLPEQSLQTTVDEAVFSGSALLLVTLDAEDLADDPQVAAQLSAGSETECCTSTADLAACRAEARTTCFAGDALVKRSSGSPDNVVLRGSVSAGALDLRAPHIQLRIPLSYSSPLELSLKAGQLRGTATGSQITDGALAGAIPRSDIETILAPEIARLANNLYTDPDADPSTRDMLAGLLDANGDGTVATQEVLSSALIGPLLKGDVDVDQDGEKELSFGIGFSAVRCEITNFEGF